MLRASAQISKVDRFVRRIRCLRFPVEADNSLRLEDTWFLEPVPLPEAKSGPGLFVLDVATPQYEIFRRYLFDWRTSLVTPLALLLNASGHAIKIYASVPNAEQVKADMAHPGTGAAVSRRLPGDAASGFLQARRGFSLVRLSEAGTALFGKGA